jgi:hypothetical protein
MQGNGSLEPLLKFPIKPSRTGPNINPRVFIFAPDYNNRFDFSTLFASQLTAGVWKNITLDLRTPDSTLGTPNLAAIRGLELYFRNNNKADVYKIDNIRLEESENQWSLTISAGTGGTVDPSGTIHGAQGASTPTIIATPNVGYKFSHWLLDGVQHIMENPISSIINDVLSHTLQAVFMSEAVPPPAAEVGLPEIAVASLAVVDAALIGYYLATVFGLI